MKTHEIRRDNLHLLTSMHASQRELADAIGIAPAYLNQLLHSNRNVGEKTARKIERNLGLGELWMDDKRGGTVNYFTTDIKRILDDAMTGTDTALLTRADLDAIEYCLTQLSVTERNANLDLVMMESAIYKVLGDLVGKSLMLLDVKSSVKSGHAKVTDAKRFIGQVVDNVIDEIQKSVRENNNE